MSQIIFNGKTYNSLEDMPVNERQAYEHLQQIFVDANGNGIPDFMEGDMAKNVMTAVTRIMGSDGQVYNNLDSLPPEKRERVERALAKLNQMGIFTGGTSTMTATTTTTESTPVPPTTTDPAIPAPPAIGSASAPSFAQGFEPAFAPSKPLIPQESASQDVGRTRGMVFVIAIAAMLLVCAVGAAAFYFMR